MIPRLSTQRKPIALLASPVTLVVETLLASIYKVRLKVHSSSESGDEVYEVLKGRESMCEDAAVMLRVVMMATHLTDQAFIEHFWWHMGHCIKP